MANPSNDKEFLEMVIKEFGEVLVHNIVFKSNDSAVSFFTSLSFIKQTDRGPSMPSHIKAFLLEANNGFSLSIAGKLTAEESLEIRKKCLSAGIKDEFIAIGESQSSTAQWVNSQLGTGKESSSEVSKKEFSVALDTSSKAFSCPQCKTFLPFELDDLWKPAQAERVTEGGFLSKKQYLQVKWTKSFECHNCKNTTVASVTTLREKSTLSGFSLDIWNACEKGPLK